MNSRNLNLPIRDDVTEASTSATASRPIAPRAANTGVIELDVVSDVICPWCFVGKRRLEKAIGMLEDFAKIKVTWRPFQLNPGMPREGLDRREYRRAKFGSLERSDQLDARLTAVGAGEGIDFHLERIARTPNTLGAHRLIWLAQRHGVQDAVVEKLFSDYFVEGRDIGDMKNLLTAAEAAGLDAAVAGEFFSTDAGVNEVLAEEAKFKVLGIEGVPSFVVDGAVLFSGAAEPPAIAAALSRFIGAANQ